MNFLLLVCAIPTLCTAFSGKHRTHSTSYRTAWAELQQPFMEKAKIFACSTSTFTYACKKSQFQELTLKVYSMSNFLQVFFPQKVTHKKAGNNNRELCCHMTSVVCGFRAEVT